MESRYNGALVLLRETIELTKSNHVIGIRAKNGMRCQETYPCQGHGDAIITLEDGSILSVHCSSVEMGALMWYFKCGEDAEHFTEYIDEAFATYLTENVCDVLTFM